MRALVRQFRTPVLRPYSRSLIARFAPTGLGLEVGVGAQTIAPIQRTLLSDGFQSHASDQTLATVFFPAGKIPYPDQHFAFLLSEHVLEHVPNVMEVLREWKRVLKPGGVLFLFLPHPDRTFDQGRELTALSHLLDEAKNVYQKNEDTHYEEWVTSVLAKGRATHYANLSQVETLQTNSLHRHVWNEITMSELLRTVGFEIIESHANVPDRTDSFCVIASLAQTSLTLSLLYF